MVNINITLPASVYATYADAATDLNRRFGNTEPRLEAKTLIAFTLARYDSADVCGHFDLALRIARAEAKPLPNPVLK